MLSDVILKYTHIYIYIYIFIYLYIYMYMHVHKQVPPPPSMKLGEALGFRVWGVGDVVRFGASDSGLQVVAFVLKDVVVGCVSMISKLKLEKVSESLQSVEGSAVPIP